MERDPILFAWRSAPARHASAAALALGLGGPLVALVLFCLRDLVHALLNDEAARLPFLRAVLPLADGDRTLMPGWSLAPVDLDLAAFVCLALAALALAGLGWVVARRCFSAQARAADRLRRTVTEAILTAPPAARDDARSLTRLVGEALMQMDDLLAAAILVPAITVGSVILALAMAALAAPRLVPVAALGLVAAALAQGLIRRRTQARSALRRREREAAEAVLSDLVRRMPAVRLHGSADSERARLAKATLTARFVLGRAEARLAYARAPALAFAVILPALALGAALWRGGTPDEPLVHPVAPSDLAAAGAAFLIAALAIAQTLRLLMVREKVAPAFQEIARTLDGLARRRRQPARAEAPPFPESGRLVAQGVGAFDPATGERLAGVDLSLAMPGHVAIMGGRGSGSRALAAILAGQVEPTAGSVTYAGHDLRGYEAAERARRFAFVGGEAVLMSGSLRDNLLYGLDAPAIPADPKLVALLRLVGLDAFVYARGLTGRIDPGAAPNLSRAVVAARNAVREALRAEGAERLVEPFDPARYNHQATIGENILFGEAVGPGFAPANFARHPYLRAVLEAEGLSRPLAEIGLQVARSTVEIFSELPNDHPLFDGFSLFPADERGYFEDLIGRQADATRWRRGPAGQRDRERLVGLALRYSETRHRFGLVDTLFEEQVVEARHTFARLLPVRMRGKVEFYDPARVNAAASLEENLLFGRVTQGEAGAEARVRAIVRRVLVEEGLERAVYRLGLDSRVEPGQPGGGGGIGEGAIGPRERIAIELARALARKPDIAVVAILLDERKPADFRERLGHIRAARHGKGLIVCLPDAADLADLDPFDAVIEVARNTLVPVAQAAE